MKTAILISGQMRTFKKCYPTQKWQIFRHYEPDIHFFVSCCNDAQADDAELLRSDYASVEIEKVDDPDNLPDIPKEKGVHAPYANATSHAKLMLQHWGNQRVWSFFCQHADWESFDTIIRIRPDLWIHRFQPPYGTIYFAVNPLAAFCPWWGKFGGINDRLAVMGRTAAQHYFTTYEAIHDLLEKGSPFHPETLVSENLRRNGITVSNTLMTEFSTIRMDGSQRWAEIVMSDVAELIAATR